MGVLALCTCGHVRAALRVRVHGHTSWGHLTGILEHSLRGSTGEGARLPWGSRREGLTVGEELVEHRLTTEVSAEPTGLVAILGVQLQLE